MKNQKVNIEMSKFNNNWASIFCILLSSLLNIQIAFGQLSPDSINFIIKRAVENKRSVGIVVGVINENGSQVYGYGKVKDNSNQQPDGNTIFEIGSITKTFTTLVLADMVIKGELNLNDPISKYLPKSVKTPVRNEKEITLLDLATHTSGLPPIPDNMNAKDPDNPYADYSVEQLYYFLSHYILTRDIGTQYEYSNLGMGLLGHILSLRAGVDYETLIKERICEPLKMNSTEIKLTPELESRLTTPHDENELAVKNWDFLSLPGCGAIRSTVNDMLIFTKANIGLTQTKLSPAIELTHIIHGSSDVSDQQIALGWQKWNKYGRQIYCHGGATSGYFTYVGFDKKSKTGIVVLSNSYRSINDIALHILESKFPVCHLNKVVQVPDTTLQKYCGVYKKTDGSIKKINFKDHSLWYKNIADGKSSKMYFTSDTDYFTYLFPNEHCIYLDKYGKVKGLKTKAGNVYAQKIDSINSISDQLNGLAWDAIENSSFNDAINYLKKGLKADSTNLFLWGNFAHANLFMGNYAKAIEIYKKHMGQNLNINFTWEAMIKSDFSALKKDGLPLEQMDKVLNELNLTIK